MAETEWTMPTPTEWPPTPVPAPTPAATLDEYRERKVRDFLGELDERGAPWTSDIKTAALNLVAEVMADMHVHNSHP